jgi:hypothetical protein
MGTSPTLRENRGMPTRPQRPQKVPSPFPFSGVGWGVRSGSSSRSELSSSRPGARGEVSPTDESDSAISTGEAECRSFYRGRVSGSVLERSARRPAPAHTPRSQVEGRGRSARLVRIPSRLRLPATRRRFSDHEDRRLSYSPRRPAPGGEEDRMAGFLFRLETPEGVPAEPPTLRSAVPNWQAGDTIPLGRRTLRVMRMRDDDGDAPPALVVEEASARLKGPPA